MTMMARIWRMRVQRDRADEYERFAREISLPMFRRQQGFAGVLMLRREEECAVVSLWRAAEDIAALDRSASYKETVGKILGRGFLFGEETVERFDVHLIEMPPGDQGGASPNG